MESEVRRGQPSPNSSLRASAPASRALALFHPLPMFTSFFAEHGIVLLGMATVALAGSRRIRSFAAAAVGEAETDPDLPDRVSDRATLAGVSLRALLSDPCGPGAALRDALMHGPMPPNL